MHNSYQTDNELQLILKRQLFTLESELKSTTVNLDLIGELFPGSLMVHDMATLTVSYMNKWGCDGLHHELEDIQKMGAAYFDKFLIPEETQRIIPDIVDYFQRDDHSETFSFFQQVKTGARLEPSWHYTACKFLQMPDGGPSSRLILVSNPVMGMGFMADKVNKLLDENVYVAKNYKLFVKLTKREKEILSLVASGQTTRQISDSLFLSTHTVNTHRKNILEKTNLKTFAQLLKFAEAFELIK